MSYDPFGNDPDADLFGEEEIILEDQKQHEDIESRVRNSNHKHTIDGTECPTCKITHPNFSKDIPDEVEEAILSFLDAMPDGMALSILESDGEGGREHSKPQAEVLSAFLSYAEALDSQNTVGPILLAIVEHLDEETNGRISKKWNVYEAERSLVVSHKVLKSANKAFESAKTDETHPSMIHLLNITLDFAQERMNEAKEKYLIAAEIANMEPVSEVLESGTYPENFDRQVKEMIVDELYKMLVVT